MEFDYIKERLEKQMDYYHNKSVRLRREYYILSSIMIVFNAIIPVLSIGLDTSGFLKYIIATMSAAASILSSLQLLRKTKETWINYRDTYEKLKKEKVLFLSSADRYKDASMDAFIINCESIMESERNSWKSLNQKEYIKKE